MHDHRTLHHDLICAHLFTFATLSRIPFHVQPAVLLSPLRSPTANHVPLPSSATPARTPVDNGTRFVVCRSGEIEM
jgi:hypothetical protein